MMLTCSRTSFRHTAFRAERRPLDKGLAIIGDDQRILIKPKDGYDNIVRELADGAESI